MTLGADPAKADSRETRREFDESASEPAGRSAYRWREGSSPARDTLRKMGAAADRAARVFRDLGWLQAAHSRYCISGRILRLEPYPSYGDRIGNIGRRLPACSENPYGG